MSRLLSRIIFWHPTKLLLVSIHLIVVQYIGFFSGRKTLYKIAGPTMLYSRVLVGGPKVAPLYWWSLCKSLSAPGNNYFCRVFPVTLCHALSRLPIDIRTISRRSSL